MNWLQSKKWPELNTLRTSKLLPTTLENESVPFTQLQLSTGSAFARDAVSTAVASAMLALATMVAATATEVAEAAEVADSVPEEAGVADPEVATATLPMAAMIAASPAELQCSIKWMSPTPLALSVIRRCGSWALMATVTSNPAVRNLQQRETEVIPSQLLWKPASMPLRLPPMMDSPK